jgi:hypothetical protein
MPRALHPPKEDVMSKRSLVMGLVAGSVLFAASAVRADDWWHTILKSEWKSVSGFGVSINLQHTFAKAQNWTDGQAGSMAVTWGPDWWNPAGPANLCEAWDPYGCDWLHSGSWAANTFAWWDNGSNVWWHYQRSSPGTYMNNGVCHQATNRAIRYTGMSTVVQIGGVDGAGVSQGVYGTCGKAFPYYGWGFSCP